MLTLIAGLIGYLSYCIFAFLTKIVIWTAYAIGVVLCFMIKHGIKLLGYCAKFLLLVGYLIFQQFYLFYQKRQVKNKNAAFYAEPKT